MNHVLKPLSPKKNLGCMTVFKYSMRLTHIDEAIQFNIDVRNTI